eukprot:COSAG01_NODE_36109_length_522_cov_0.732861_1_plen_47_part_10
MGKGKAGLSGDGDDDSVASSSSVAVVWPRSGIRPAGTPEESAVAPHG